VALVAEQQTSDWQVAGSRPGWAPLHSGLWQATYTCVPLSPSTNLVPAKGDDLLGWKSNYKPGGK